jgi:hypothetical protein
MANSGALRSLQFALYLLSVEPALPVPNPKSQAPNLRVSGVGCQVSGKRNIVAET